MHRIQRYRCYKYKRTSKEVDNDRFNKKVLRQIRRDGYANVKAVQEQKKNGEIQRAKAMAPNNDYMDFRDMIQSQATKDTSNHFSISTAEKELDVTLKE